MFNFGLRYIMLPLIDIDRQIIILWVFDLVYYTISRVSSDIYINIYIIYTYTRCFITREIHLCNRRRTWNIFTLSINSYFYISITTWYFKQYFDKMWNKIKYVTLNLFWILSVNVISFFKLSESFVFIEVTN